jgi:hypothetical protein
MLPSLSRRLCVAVEERKVKYAIWLPANDSQKLNIGELLSRPLLLR